MTFHCVIFFQTKYAAIHSAVLGLNYWTKTKLKEMRSKQECIPVGCVQSTAVAVCWRGSAQGVSTCWRVSACWGVCCWGCLPRGCTPPRFGQTDTFPQLVLRTVINRRLLFIPLLHHSIAILIGCKSLRGLVTIVLESPNGPSNIFVVFTWIEEVNVIQWVS